MTDHLRPQDTWDHRAFAVLGQAKNQDKTAQLLYLVCILLDYDSLHQRWATWGLGVTCGSMNYLIWPANLRSSSGLLSPLTPKVKIPALWNESAPLLVQYKGNKELISDTQMDTHVPKLYRVKNTQILNRSRSRSYKLTATSSPSLREICFSQFYWLKQSVWKTFENSCGGEWNSKQKSRQHGFKPRTFPLSLRSSLPGDLHAISLDVKPLY